MNLLLLTSLLILGLSAQPANAYLLSGVEINHSSVWVIYRNYATAPGAPSDIFCDIEVTISNNVRELKKNGKAVKCADFTMKDIATMTSPVKSPNIPITNLFKEIAKNPSIKWIEGNGSNAYKRKCTLRFDISNDSNPLQNLCAYADRELYEGSDSSVK